MDDKDGANIGLKTAIEIGFGGRADRGDMNDRDVLAFLPTCFFKHVVTKNMND
jgi:hypothetical protein